MPVAVLQVAGFSAMPCHQEKVTHLLNRMRDEHVDTVADSLVVETLPSGQSLLNSFCGDQAGTSLRALSSIFHFPSSFGYKDHSLPDAEAVYMIDSSTYNCVQ